MNLLLVRHAQAVGVGAVKQDIDRGLTRRGRELMAQMAGVLVDENIVPKRILVSPAQRACETVQQLLSVIGPVEVEEIPALYQASAMTILEVIHRHGGGADPLMVVGHNPGLETTVSNIAGNLVPFPTGAIAHAVIEANSPSVVVAVWRPDELPAV
jgi:phosphohistidine phosphatase